MTTHRDRNRDSGINNPGGDSLAVIDDRLNRIEEVDDSSKIHWTIPPEGLPPEDDPREHGGCSSGCSTRATDCPSPL